MVFWGQPEWPPGTLRISLRLAAGAEKSGIVDLRFHGLRHEAVSGLMEADLGDQEVAVISDHKSMQMLRCYTHPRAEDLVERLDQFGEWVKSVASAEMRRCRDSLSVGTIVFPAINNAFPLAFWSSMAGLRNGRHRVLRTQG